MELPTDVLQELLCSNCGGYLSRGPVLMLNSGTYLCGRCKEFEERGATRIIPYEHLAKFMAFPCTYQDNGCQQKVLFADNQSHEDGCAYRQFVCPVVDSGKCEWTGIRGTFLKHCQEMHPDNVIQNPYKFSHNISESSIHNYVMSALGVLFLVQTKVCTNSRKIYNSVRLIGDKNQAFKYNFVVDIENNENRLTKKRDVAPEGFRVLQEDTSIVMDINGLLMMLNGFKDVMFTLTVQTKDEEINTIESIVATQQTNTNEGVTSMQSGNSGKEEIDIKDNEKTELIKTDKEMKKAVIKRTERGNSANYIKGFKDIFTVPRQRNLKEIDNIDPATTVDSENTQIKSGDEKKKTKFNEFKNMFALTLQKKDEEIKNKDKNQPTGTRLSINSTAECVTCKCVKPLLYCNVNGCFCEDCAPNIKLCIYSAEGCTYKDSYCKSIKHQMHFCQYRNMCRLCGYVITADSMDVHYREAHSDITYKSGIAWTATVSKNFTKCIIIDSDIGKLLCGYYISDTEFYIVIYTSLLSEQLYMYRCEVEITHPCTQAKLTRLADAGYLERHDWKLYISRSEINSFIENLAFKIMVNFHKTVSLDK